MSKVILTEVKDHLGILPEYTQYDSELVLYINMALNTLTQLGVGPSGGFEITVDGGETLEDFVAGGPLDNVTMHNQVINYLALRTKLLWDPPQSSSMIEVYKTQIEELGWRLNVQVDPVRTFA